MTQHCCTLLCGYPLHLSHPLCTHVRVFPHVAVNLLRGNTNISLTCCEAAWGRQKNGLSQDSDPRTLKTFAKKLLLSQSHEVFLAVRSHEWLMSRAIPRCVECVWSTPSLVNVWYHSWHCLDFKPSVLVSFKAFTLVPEALSHGKRGLSKQKDHERHLKLHRRSENPPKW